MQRIAKRILNAIRKSPLTAIEALQQKTLNALVWGVGICCFLLRIFLLIMGDPSIGEPGRNVLYIAMPLCLIGMILILFMQRYVAYWMTSLIFLLFLILMTFLADTLPQVLAGETLIFFIIPIAIAGLLLRPWAGFAVAGMIIVVDTIFVIRLHLGIPNFVDFILFFLIALIIEQSTNRLQQAMKQEQIKSQELHESEEKYHRLIDLLPLGVLIYQDGKVVLVNPACLKIIKATKAEEVLGTGLIDHVHPDSQPIMQERVREALLEDKTSTVVEEKFYRLDGSTFYADATGTPFMYNGRQAILVVFNDVSDRKRIHEAIALKNMHIQEMSRKLLEVQEKERHLLAAELHDDLGQSLTSLKLMLELSNRSRSSTNRLKKIAEARSLVVDLMNKVRNLSLDLRPAMLDDFGLFAALRWLYDRFESQTGIVINCTYDLDSQQRFESHLETAAFRIIQEALTNIARHASVREAQVSIISDGVLRIEVTDRGTGFNVDLAIRNVTGSAGLSGMLERARLVGGSVEIISNPASGTRVIAQMPLTGSVQ